MRTRTLAVGAVAGALAVGGTAVAAAGDGGPLGFIRADRDRTDAQLAKDLAAKLHGPSAAEIQKALGEVRDERMAQHRKQEADAIAAELDGVSSAQVAKALEKLEGKFERIRPRKDFGRGTRLRRHDFAADLAKELGKSTADVRKALRAARKKQFEARLDQAVKDGRLTRAQADRIKKRFESGPPRFGRRFHHDGPGFRRPGGPPGRPGFERPGFGGPPPPGVAPS
jgi:hypothetical protein